MLADSGNRLLRVALIALPLMLALAGCETFDKLNPFAERETPLPGERKPVFPEGVPGVEFGAAPPQPSNANIPIPSSFGEGSNQGSAQDAGQGQPPAQSARGPQPIQPASPQQPATSSKSKPVDPDDAWAGTR